MDVEIERPHHHHKTGHHWLDKVVPLSALLISAVSIGVAYHHGHVMQALVQQNERLVQANSLPYVQLGRSDITVDGRLRTSLSAWNNGVGPALIRSVQIKVDGHPVATIKELMSACCGPRKNERVGTSTMINRMVRAGEELRYIEVEGNAAELNRVKTFNEATSSDRIVTTVCYCSVFEECWISSSAGEANVRPQHVDSCPMPEPQYRS